MWKDDAPVDLTPIEYDLLHALARHSGMVLSREQLIQQVWGHDYSHGLATYHLELCVARPCDYGDERVVDVHIGRLRKKIEDDPSDPTFIVTVRGAGYRFEAVS